MSPKSVPPDKPYVYAFSSGRLVLLVCVVLAMMALSLMLGIRIERFQEPSNFAIGERGGPTPPKPQPKPAETPPEAATAAAVAQPQEATPAAPEKPEAEPPASSEQPPPAPEKPKAAEPAPAPKPEPKVAAPAPKPEPKAAAPAPKPEPKKPAPPPAKKEEAPTFHYAVQLSSSQDKSLAGSHMELLKGKGFASYVEEIDLGAKGRFFRVMVGPFQTEAEAKKARGQLAEDSRFADSYVRYLP